MGSVPRIFGNARADFSAIQESEDFLCATRNNLLAKTSHLFHREAPCPPPIAETTPPMKKNSSRCHRRLAARRGRPRRSPDGDDRDPLPTRCGLPRHRLISRRARIRLPPPTSWLPRAGWLSRFLEIRYEAYVNNNDFSKSLDIRPGAAIRLKPKADAPIFATMHEGDKTEITGLRSGWTQINLYAPSSATSRPARPPPRPAPLRCP